MHRLGGMPNNVTKNNIVYLRSDAMNEKIAALIKAKEDNVVKMEALITSAGDHDFTEEQQKEFDAFEAECVSLDGRIAREEKLLDLKASTAIKSRVEPEAVKVEDVADYMNPERATRIEVPSMGRWADKLKCFTDEAGQEAAYKQGRMLMAILGDTNSAQWCRDHGLTPKMVHNEGVNIQGGYLVLPEFDASVVKLELQYGKFEPNARNVPMLSDQKMRDRKTGGLTMVAVGESEAGDESTMGWDQFQLIARKWMVLTRITNELSADSIINIMDELASDVARASAKKKDEAGFAGDGTSTYHGITGINQKLIDINGVDEGGGVIVATDNIMSGVTITDFNKTVAILPDFPGLVAKWYCSKFFYHSVMERLLTALGGITLPSVEAGGSQRQFLGYPLVFSEVFPKSDTNSQVLALLGDLDLSSDIGDRQATTIAQSTSASVGGQSVFERDQLAIRWTERWDISNHDLGTATVAGPVVALIAKAS